MANVRTAMRSAGHGCFEFLARELDASIGADPFDVKRDETAFYGQTMPEDMANIWCFLLSGGRDQVQNRQHARPQTQWAGQAQLHGQFQTEDGAWDFLGKVMDLFELTADADNIVIKPNVRVFRPSFHPELADQAHQMPDSKRFHILWHVRIEFLVVYGIEQT